MNDSRLERGRERLTTPRAAGIAGILFAMLFGAGLILVRMAIPQELTADTDWLVEGRSYISVAMIIMPFAGIAFLWFIGVVRDLLGEYEDQFFSTVFFGSALLFLALTFVSMAIVGGLVAGLSLDSGSPFKNEIIIFARSVTLQIANVYALRMAGVMMLSLGTIWLRTRLVARWLVILTYLLAILLLVVINLNLWIVLVFPGWVLLVSVYVLVDSRNRGTEEGTKNRTS
jgi:hypothetical protein